MDEIKKRVVTVKRQTMQKPSASLDPMRDFYYANTYPEDVQKARNMQNNVYFDLKPFSAYIPGPPHYKYL